MAVILPALAIASTAISAVGAISSAQAQAKSYESQKNMANYNATVQRDNANATLAASAANELALRRENDVKLSFERGRMIESGGGLVGTNVGALEQAGMNLELNALNLRYRGAMQARGDLQQATYDEYQADVAGQNASSAKTAGWIGAAGKVLGGAASYYGAGQGAGF